MSANAGERSNGENVSLVQRRDVAFANYDGLQRTPRGVEDLQNDAAITGMRMWNTIQKRGHVTLPQSMFGQVSDDGDTVVKRNHEDAFLPHLQFHQGQ